jgi:hypothetical protein
MAETTPTAAEQINHLIAAHVKSTRAALEALVKKIVATDKAEVEKVRATLYKTPTADEHATPAITPAATDPQLPDLSLIWPTIMGVRAGWTTGFAAQLPHSSPQLVSDLALGLAVITICTNFINLGYSIYNPWFYPSIVLFSDTLGNTANVPLLPFAPAAMDDATLELWFRRQMPDLTPAELFPTGPTTGNSLVQYIIWGMASSSSPTTGTSAASPPAPTSPSTTRPSPSADASSPAAMAKTSSSAASIFRSSTTGASPAATTSPSSPKAAPTASASSGISITTTPAAPPIPPITSATSSIAASPPTSSPSSCSPTRPARAIPTS